MKSVFILMMCSLVFLLAGPTQAQEPEQPNIIFILGDDQAWWDYGFMRQADVEQTAIGMNPSIYPVAQTPAIDRLANNGLTFTHGYTTPLCRPSLASLVTGTHPHQHFVTGNDFPGRAPDESVEERMRIMQTIPRILTEELGYKSFQTGKWWEGDYSNGGFSHGDTRNSVSTSNPNTRPPQWSGGKPSYVTDRHGDWGLMIGRVDYVNNVAAPAHPINYANTVTPVTDYIDQQVAAEERFFIWYAPFLPHTPHDAPSGLVAKYDALINEPGETGNYQAKYYANVERYDGGIGAILDHLDALEITDNTLIILYCDNGWINQDNASAYADRSKRTAYEGGIRTPIIIHWPDKIKAGGAIEPRFVRTPVTAVDIAPTALAAVGLEPSPEMRGINLLDLDAVDSRPCVFGEANHVEIQNLTDPAASLQARFVLKDGWKLIDFAGTSQELYHLFDADTDAPIDPHETNDLSSAEPTRAAELSAAGDAWYHEPTSMEWEAGQAQRAATALHPFAAELGQTFTTDAEQKIAGIRVGLKPVSASRPITLELRELDGNGAPLGHLLASAALSPDQLVANETRWYLFPFAEPVTVAPSASVGFRLTSSSGAGSYEAAYNDSGFYSGGAFYFSGLIDGLDWTRANLDLAFEVLRSNYDAGSRLRMAFNGAEVGLTGHSRAKEVPAVLRRSRDLGIWTAEGTNANRDGRAFWRLPLSPSNEFFKISLQTTGAPFYIQGNLYVEDFAGTGGDLNETEPDTTSGAVAWTAPAGVVFRDDGSMSVAADGTAYLPFTPRDGNIYSLRVQMKQGSTDSSDWIAFGFLKEPPSTAMIHTSGNGVLWALTRNYSGDDNQVLHENVSGGAGSVQRGNYLTGAATVTMSLVLDTTGGTGNWKYDWVVDGVTREAARPLPATFESAIGGVGIAKNTGLTTFSFSSFSLSQDVAPSAP